ncbi:MAG: hypothetical protein K6347_02465 [Campylobacterales bacterium]
MFRLMYGVGLLGLALMFGGCATKLETRVQHEPTTGSYVVTAAPNYSPLNFNPAQRLNGMIAYTLQVAAQAKKRGQALLCNHRASAGDSITGGWFAINK